MSSLCLTDDLSIYHALEQKTTLLEALATTDALDLDLSQVAEIDSAGLQLLMLIDREAQRSGKAVTLVAHSAAVGSAIALCNLAATGPLFVAATAAS